MTKFLRQSKHRFLQQIKDMKILSILFLMFLLNNCSGSNFAKIKFGERCTASDAKQLQRKSYVWFVSKDAIKGF